MDWNITPQQNVVWNLESKTNLFYLTRTLSDINIKNFRLGPSHLNLDLKKHPCVGWGNVRCDFYDLVILYCLLMLQRKCECSKCRCGGLMSGAAGKWELKNEQIGQLQTKCSQHRGQSEEFFLHKKCLLRDRVWEHLQKQCLDIIWDMRIIVTE